MTTNEDVILATPEVVAEHRIRYWMESEADKLRDRCKRLTRERDEARKGARGVN